MRYLCTIFTHDCTFSGGKGSVGTDPAFDSPVASVIVSGLNRRDAAARAYVRCVGRQRARWLREQGMAPEEVVAQETSRRAIAASLRKIPRRIGECYEMDNLYQAWSIKVEPAPAHLLPSRRLRLSQRHLYQLSRSSFPN